MILIFEFLRSAYIGKLYAVLRNRYHPQHIVLPLNPVSKILRKEEPKSLLTEFAVLLPFET